ncbi:MAG: hypothetical protein UV77_C0006G0050 [Candidatus Nomurabacteria bacterium GW2011_GWA1_43_17]|nr:MAG: hypothetical protein UV77_C0006G0050 [Candidatus Nomurabacteria bacterium GW2011_GWA1_43_17]
MSKKLILVLVLGLFFFKFNLVQAGVIINEFVPYGATEWVELLNTTNSDIPLDGWSLVDAANHIKSLTPLGSISAHGIVVYEYNAASSGWLNNDADSIELRDAALEPKDKVSYGTTDLAVPSTGKSAALISGDWQTNQEPTKDTANLSSSNNGDSNDSTEDEFSSDTITPASVADTKPVSSKIKTEISVRNIAYVGIPLAFQGKVMQGKQLFRGRYFWNFGDGDFREVKIINTDKFTHTYFYPGDYDVVLDYYPNFFADTPAASQKITVKVVPAGVSISRTGDEKDFFVELTNNSNYNADISNWKITSSAKSFTIPRNTIMTPKKQMIISSRITGFSVADRGTLKLLSPVGEAMSDYSFSVKPVKVTYNKPVFAPLYSHRFCGFNKRRRR